MTTKPAPNPTHQAPRGFAPPRNLNDDPYWQVHEGPSLPTHTQLGTIYSSWHPDDGLLINFSGEDLTLPEARKVLEALTALVRAVERAVS